MLLNWIIVNFSGSHVHTTFQAPTFLRTINTTSCGKKVPFLNLVCPASANKSIKSFLFKWRLNETKLKIRDFWDVARCSRGLQPPTLQMTAALLPSAWSSPQINTGVHNVWTSEFYSPDSNIWKWHYRIKTANLRTLRADSIRGSQLPYDPDFLSFRLVAKTINITTHTTVIKLVVYGKNVDLWCAKTGY